MRAIDADALEAVMRVAINGMKLTAKIFGISDEDEAKATLKAYEDILNGIKEQPTVEAAGCWVPCSDHLPEEYEVLCCDIRGEIMIGHPFSTSESSTGFSAESEHEYMYDCVAWMQKPKGYRPKENKQ